MSPDKTKTYSIGYTDPQMLLVVNLRLQTWDDLKLLVAILILRPFNLRRFRTTLLLGLTNFDPFLHRQVLAKLRELVLSQTKSLQQRTIIDGVEDDVVVGSVAFVRVREERKVRE